MSDDGTCGRRGRVVRVTLTFENGETVTCEGSHIAGVQVDDWVNPAGQPFKNLLVLRLVNPASEPIGAKT